MCERMKFLNYEDYLRRKILKYERIIFRYELKIEKFKKELKTL